ncbi:MAG: hypothetical protein Q7J27_04320 [Syntrophales bacterium]|nr:hypothetical protein [Syntrophales bacterium]
MTNEAISYTTIIISIVGVVFAFFAGFFRLFRRNKNAIIELLNERVRQLENPTTDIITKQLTERLAGAHTEIVKLKEEQIRTDFKNTALQELGNITEQTIGLQKRIQILQNIDPMIEKAFSFPATAVPSKDPPTINDDEEGEWELSVRYITSDSSEKDVQLISVEEAKYTFHQGNVKIFFDFSVDLKKVPSGSALAIGGVPFRIDSRNVYEFKVRQTGLNHSEDLTFSPRYGDTSFDLLYVTDGSEGSVRFWGYIAYDGAQ